MPERAETEYLRTPHDNKGLGSRAMNKSLGPPKLGLGGVLILCLIGCSPGMIGAQQVADQIREIERQRLRALVEADVDTADRLHADDFQLITPSGREFNKESYLGQIHSGVLDYRVWDADEITVRLYEDVAVIRYADRGFEVWVEGTLTTQGLLQHTTLYERRNGASGKSYGRMPPEAMDANPIPRQSFPRREWNRQKALGSSSFATEAGGSSDSK